MTKVDFPSFSFSPLLSFLLEISTLNPFFLQSLWDCFPAVILVFCPSTCFQFEFLSVGVRDLHSHLNKQHNHPQIWKNICSKNGSENRLRKDPLGFVLNVFHHYNFSAVTLLPPHCCSFGRKIMALAESGITSSLDFFSENDLICWFLGGETWTVYNFMKLFVMEQQQLSVYALKWQQIIIMGGPAHRTGSNLLCLLDSLCMTKQLCGAEECKLWRQCRCILWH